METIMWMPATGRPDPLIAGPAAKKGLLPTDCEAEGRKAFPHPIT